MSRRVRVACPMCNGARIMRWDRRSSAYVGMCDRCCVGLFAYTTPTEEQNDYPNSKSTGLRYLYRVAHMRARARRTRAQKRNGYS